MPDTDGEGGGVDGAGGGYVAVGVAPDGSTVALANTKIELVFDRYLDPRTVQRSSVCLRSDANPVEGFAQCSGGVFLNAAYDPVGRVVTYYVDPSQTPQLLPATTHFLTVHLGDEPGEAGFRAFDGAPLEQKYEMFFDVVDPGGLIPQGPPTLTHDDCETATEALGGCGSCHGPESAGGPAEGVSFLPTETIGARLQRVAHGASLGGTGNQGSARADRLGAGMSLITPNDPGNSYVLYKLLAGRVISGDTLEPDEIRRVRAELITGMPMPPGNVQDRFGEPGVVLEPRFTEDSIRTVSRWIAAGAPACADVP